MKKFLISILSTLLAVCLLIGLVACGGESSWEKPTLTDGGSVKSYGGFICETDKYLYYINGVGDSTSDNSYGTPIKGSLMAVDKATIGTDAVKTEIIVPKLFCAGDFGAGVYIYDGFVYYGTPSTDKDSSGKVQSSEMAFMKSKLDGSDKPVKLFTVSSLTTEYRIVKGADSVYVVYFDATDSSLKTYCDKTGKTEVILKTDATTNVGENGLYLSLDTVKFVANDSISDAAVIYTVKVYNEKYFADKASSDDYSRGTASYNLVYKYKAGEAPKLILDGKDGGITYTLLKAGLGNAFVCAADQKGNDNCFAVSLADETKTVKINNESNVADTTLFIGLDKIYTFDSDAKVIYENSLTAEEKTAKKVVAKIDTVNTLVAVKGEYIYFVNGEGKLVRKQLGNVDAKEQNVSNGTINTAWYKPQVISIGEKDYIFYIDTTTVGSSYVYFVDMNAEIEEKDSDDDGTVDTYTLKGQTLLGAVTDADKANVIKNAINNIEAVLKLEKDGDSLYSASVKNARELYNNAPDKVKENVGSDHIVKLENAEKAVELANLYAKLEGVEKFETAEDAKDFKTAYENAKSFRQTLIELVNKDGETRYGAIRDMLENNLKYYYQQASKLFEE